MADKATAAATTTTATIGEEALLAAVAAPAVEAAPELDAPVVVEPGPTKKAKPELTAEQRAMETKKRGDRRRRPINGRGRRRGGTGAGGRAAPRTPNAGEEHSPSRAAGACHALLRPRNARPAHDHPRHRHGLGELGLVRDPAPSSKVNCPHRLPHDGGSQKGEKRAKVGSHGRAAHGLAAPPCGAGAHSPFRSFSSRTPSSRNLSHGENLTRVTTARGAENTREKSSPAGKNPGKFLPEGEIDAIAIVIELDIISIIIIIISTIYTAITTAAPRHRCNNLGWILIV
ncbi:hypothetical protein QYE76_070894 [Lolium multiflorum]|uniref:Uncharacterized protein n=1 Tax=Lolium multiflorum TaxID=4521 RepID=A0AAD8WGA5_LOLMU|nr:hypothetical protein QYE76_070894 [Lolium multiflorum]